MKQGRRGLEAFLSLFACPACGDGLTLDVFDNDEDGVCQECLLVCRRAGHWYSVSDGSPVCYDRDRCAPMTSRTVRAESPGIENQLP